MEVRITLMVSVTTRYIRLTQHFQPMLDGDWVLCVGLDLAGVVSAVVLLNAADEQVVAGGAQVEAVVALHQHVPDGEHSANGKENHYLSAEQLETLLNVRPFYSMHSF